MTRIRWEHFPAIFLLYRKAEVCTITEQKYITHLFRFFPKRLKVKITFRQSTKKHGYSLPVFIWNLYKFIFIIYINICVFICLDRDTITEKYLHRDKEREREKTMAVNKLLEKAVTNFRAEEWFRECVSVCRDEPEERALQINAWLMTRGKG